VCIIYYFLNFYAVPDISTVSAIDTVWVLVASFLVFFMQAGFALLEAGFTQAKNAVNIIMKNFLDVAVGTVMFFIVGFAFMFGGGDFIGSNYFFLEGIPDVWPDTAIPGLAFFLFQSVFAATAATIVSGAVAERTKFGAYIAFSVILTAIIYPIVGHWTWGGGWLGQMGFVDFAGSTIVHSVGGWAALAGIIIVGSRVGRFSKDYDQKRFSGHSVPLAALGVFILWFGWFGFNPGSELSATGDSAYNIALIALNTQLAAAAGVFSALICGYLRTKMFKAGFAINGALGGLVAITAPCVTVTPVSALVIGIVGGFVIVCVAEILESLKLDDAVGAVPVHLGAGIWGTLAVGLFDPSAGLFYGGGFELIKTQLIGILAIGAFSFIASYTVFWILSVTISVRATAQEEKDGLDLKHGQAAYPDFS
jgi:Amt family ammonium transporter